jgi:hypothetical protein
MNTTIRKRIIRAALGVALATSLIASGPASADRDPSFTSVPQRPAEEHVLTTLTPRDNLRFETFETIPDAGRADSFQSVQAGTGANAGYGGADDIKAGPGCSIQCITSGVAYARGPAAELVVKTDTLARIWIHVEGPNGYYRVMNSGADEAMQFNAYFDDLEAGTTYTAWAVAKDTQNYESEAHGSFTTLVRNIEISYYQADLIERAFDDSADFKLQVWLDGEFDDDYNAFNLQAEGYTVPLGINSIELNDVERYLDFAIQLVEAPDPCNNLNTDVLKFGPGYCPFFSYAALLEGENDLDARPADATSWTEWTLGRTLERPTVLLWPYYDDQLLFTVPVYITVNYNPWWY